MLELDYDPSEKLGWIQSIPFFAVHVGAVVGVFYVGVTPGLVAAAAGCYLIRMWAITAGYHRYFSHRSFKTSRAFQFVMAFLGTLAVQKGVLWWAAHHRHHHRHSDQEPDLHSPTLRGMFWAHVGWFLCPKYDQTEHHKIKDFLDYPELRWLDRYHLAPPLAVGALVWLFFGLPAFIWVGLVSTVALWHGTFTINSLCHVFGRRRFTTKDTSKNSFLLALITLGRAGTTTTTTTPARPARGSTGGRSTSPTTPSRSFPGWGSYGTSTEFRSGCSRRAAKRIWPRRKRSAEPAAVSGSESSDIQVSQKLRSQTPRRAKLSSPRNSPRPRGCSRCRTACDRRRPGSECTRHRVERPES